MRSSNSLSLALFIVCALPLCAQAQQTDKTAKPVFSVDSTLAKSGKKIFGAKACGACHTMGKGNLVGPDLKGVFERRDVDWLKRWLENPQAMLATDKTAQALRKEYKGMEMPNLKLTDGEIEALLHYLATEQVASK